MNVHGIDVEIIEKPELDPEFIPLYRFNKEFLKNAKTPIGIAVERTGGIAVINTFIHGTDEMRAADHYYLNRLIKTVLWMKGGYKIYVCGDDDSFDYIAGAFCADGEQAFEYKFFSDIYEEEFKVVRVEELPQESNTPKKMGGHLDGCCIGFDAGGSDRKVSAVINGEPVFSEEVVWYPKTTEDPEYHYNEIVDALKTAAEYLPKVDAVGVSSAGIYINNRTMSASLFRKVPEELYESKVKDIYIRAIMDTFGDVPFEVVNDGDVTALAGAMSLDDNNVLGIAMGTSEAAGYVDENGNITGWLNELAFAPVDANPKAMRDDWSLDIGCGSKYFSQDAIIKLADFADIDLSEGNTPAEKLKIVQKLAENKDEKAEAVYRSMGTYLAHTLVFYHELYQFKHVLLLGRVMSGRGGDILLDTCNKVLASEYPDDEKKFSIDLPDEKFRRLGQSVAAASLPEIIKGEL